MLIYCLWAAALADPGPYLAHARPARMHTTFTLTSQLADAPAVDMSGELVVRVVPEGVQVYVHVLQGPDAGEELVLAFDAHGAVGAKRAVRKGEQVRNLPPDWVLSRFEELGLHVTDLVELAAPALRGQGWAEGSDPGTVLSPLDALGCRNLYGLGADLRPTYAGYCDGGRRRRQVEFQSWVEVGGFVLPEVVAYAQADKRGTLRWRYAPDGVSATAGAELAELLGSGP